VLGIGVAVLEHFAENGWPLANADFELVGAAGGFFLLSYAFKAFGWHRLFAPAQRPHKMALAAAGGAPPLVGQRFRDASTTPCGWPSYAAERRPA
jgi:hypothetical protein